MMTGCVLDASTKDWGLSDTEVGVMASVLIEVTRHSAELVNSKSEFIGTIWRIVFASRADTLKMIESESCVGKEYDISDSVPARVIHRFCGLLLVPAKQRLCSKYDTAPG